MTTGCDAPIRDENLLEYWCRDLSGRDADRIEEHLFACAGCAARLDRLASLQGGIAALARKGRISGIISRALLNRLQRDGVTIRVYALASGETIPCAAFPADDLVVVALRADLTGVDAVSLSVAQAGQELREITEAPARPQDREVLWATPGAVVRQMPSTRLYLTLSVAGSDRRVLGEYVLDHSAEP
jgi:Putative zinc-finger